MNLRDPVHVSNSSILHIIEQDDTGVSTRCMILPMARVIQLKVSRTPCVLEYEDIDHYMMVLR